MSNLNKFYNEKSFNIFKNSLSSSNNTKDKSKSQQEIKSFLELYDENISEYFNRLDNYDGFFNTQQLEDINYSNFEEHVFFDSAVKKTNDTIKNIYNNFPYDGNFNEVTNYLNSIDGFTRYILKEKHSKNIGYLRFDKSYYLKIIDRNGWLLNDYKKQIKTGILNLSNSFNYSFDFWLYSFSNINREANESQIICQKFDNNQGFTVYLDRFDDVNNTCYLNFLSKQEDNEIFGEIQIKTSEWQHINISCKITTGINNNNTQTIFYINGIKKVTLNNNNSFVNYNNDFNTTTLFIGKGSIVNSSITNSISDIGKNYYFEGLLDEFRIFIGENRDRKTIAEEKNENIFAKSSLKLCLRFNEPSGEYLNNNIILDHSGNKLHGVMYNSSNTSLTQQETSEFKEEYQNIKSPLKYELLEMNPVLFPNYNEISNTYDSLIEEAKRYDLINPNSFWKLMPKNLFVEGSDFDNVPEVYINEPTSEINNKLGNINVSINQKMINLFSIWARFFDQLKMYIDEITKIIEFDYESLNNNKKVSGVILPIALKLSGFNFREILPYPLIEKLNGKNLTHEELVSNLTIRQIQNNLWKRFLINSKDYMMSKGTLSAINSAFNAFGLSSKEFISIKEFNGQNKFNINNNQSIEKVTHRQIDFSCSDELFNTASNNTSSNNAAENRILFTTPEFPNSYFDITKSWTIEVLINFEKNKLPVYDLKQSLLRIENNKSLSGNYERPHINVVFERLNKHSEIGSIKAFINDTNNNNDILIANLDNIRLLNGEIHHLCLQRKVNLNADSNLQYYEYTLSSGNISENFYSKPVEISSVRTLNNLSDKSSINTQIIIGKYNLYEANNQLDNLDYTTEFQGKISNFRIYNTFLTEQQLFDKCKTINNIYLNGSLDNILLNIDLYQDIHTIQKNNNNIYEISSLIDKDHSLSSYNKSYINIGDTINNINYFPITTKKIQIVQNNYDFDFPKSNNFIYVNDFNEEKFKKQYKNFNVTNLPRTEPDFLYSKDNRLSIDFSLVQSLNKDINKIININEKFSNKLMQISNLFEDSYTDLNILQNKYFERLEKELDIPRIYQLYKYFDNILEEILYDCIPSKTNYKGFNFVYESHVLERNKYQYKMVNSLLPVIHDEYRYSYNKDLSQVKNHRISEDLNFDYISKNKR